MAYQYKSKVTAFDFWKLTMYQTYHSVAGVCNIVFTVAIILLTAKFWDRAGDMAQVLMLFGCLLFPVVQPLVIYGKARAQVKMLPEDVELLFDDAGLHVTVGADKEDILWKRIRIRKQSDLLLVFSDARHGYILTNRVLGKEKDAFYTYAKTKIEQEI